MQSLKERINAEKEKIFPPVKYKNFNIIKAKNSCHQFKIFFIISPISSIPNEFASKAISNFSIEREKMIVKAELLNKESYFNENYEEIEISEKYFEIYSLAEIKNNNSGCEFFTELNEFKDAFIKAINDNNYELLIIKNVLLLTRNIINFFGIHKICHLLLKPFINNIINHNLENTNYENVNNLIFANKENSVISTFSKLRHNNAKKNSKNNENKLPLLNNFSNKNELNKETMDKNDKTLLKLKRNRSKKLLNDHMNNILKNNASSFNNTENKENKNNIITLINDFIENVKKNMKPKLPDFEEDSLITKSSIIKNLEEASLIGDMISNLKSKKYRLIYKATRDGDSANKFHSLCDSFNNLIVLIKTKKGLRFGGFTSNKFKGSSHMKFDNNAFLFSLDLKKVYNIIPYKYAIYCYQNSGPCFSQGSLYIPNNFFKKDGKTGNAGGPYQFEKDFELNNGEEKFIVKELEIFQVLIEDL